MKKTKFKIHLTEYSYPFVYKVCKGNVPTSKMSGGRRGTPVYIHLDARKCIRFSDIIDLEEGISIGTIIFGGRRIPFEVEHPIFKIPARLNFSAFRTNSRKKQAGGRSRRPQHGWSKKKRTQALGVGVWP